MPVTTQEQVNDNLLNGQKSTFQSADELPELLDLAYDITKSAAGIHLKGLQSDPIHIYEPLDCKELIIESGSFVFHAPCNIRSLQITAKSVEFRAPVFATQIGIKAQATSFYNKLTTEMLQADIDEEFYLDDGAVLQVDVLDLQAKAANCLGTLNVAKVSRVDVNQIEFGGKSEWQGITALNTDRLVCYEGSDFSIKHSHPTYSSVLNVDEQVMLQANSTLRLTGEGKQYVVLKTKKIIQQGNLDCHTAIIDSENVVVNETATLTATKSELHFKEAVQQGALILQASLLNADDFLQTQNAKAEWRDSVVQSSSYCKVDGELRATKTKCHGANVVLRARTTLVETNIQAAALKIQTPEMSCSNSEFLGNRLLFDAMPGGKQEYDKLTLQADHLETRGAVTISHSQLNLVAAGILSNAGDLQLTDTQMVCAGQISNAKQASLKIVDTKELSTQPQATFEPTISAGYIANRGAMSVVKTKIAAKSLSHTGTAFTLDETMCFVESGLIVDENAQLTLKNKSLLISSQEAIVAAKSKIEINGDSKVQAKSLYSLVDAKLEIRDAQLSIETVGLFGESHIAQAALQSDSATVIGKLTTDNTLLFMNDYAVHHTWLKTRTQLITKNSVLLGSKAQISSVDSIIKTRQLEVQAKINLAGTAQWQAQELVTQRESSIAGSALKIDAGIWYHAGNIALEKEFQAKGAQLLNTGTISASSTNLGFNALVNAGNVTATNLNITTGSYMNIGKFGGHNVKINSLVNCNFGFTHAFNLQINALHHTNLGLYLPDLTHPDEWFTWSSMQGATKIIAINVLPDYSAYIQLAAAAPGLFKTLKAAWKAKGDLTNREKLAQYYLHDYVEHVLNVTQFINTGMQAYDQSKIIYADLPERWKSLSWESLPKSIPFTEIGKALPMAASKAFAPKMTTQCIFDVNAGVAVSSNINESVYYSFNNGAKFVYDSATIDADHIIETGDTYALTGGITYKAKDIITSGGQHPDRGRVNLQAKKVMVAAATDQKDHASFTIKSDDLQILGDHTFSSAQIKTGHLQFGAVADPGHKVTFTQDSFVDTKTVEFNQDLNLSRSTLQVDEIKHDTNIYLSEEAHLNVKGQQQIFGQGTLVVDDKSRVRSETLNLTDKAQVQLKAESTLRTETLSVEAQSLYQSNNSKTKSNSTQTSDQGHIKLENESKLHTAELTTAGTFESDKSLTFTDNADVSAGGLLELKNRSGLMTASLKTSGKIDIEESEIDAEKIHVDAAGALASTQAVLTGKMLLSEGKTSFTSTLVDIEIKVSLDQQADHTMHGSTLKTALLEDNTDTKVSGTVLLDVGHYDHHGRLQVLEGADPDKAHLVLKAKKKNLQGSSDLTKATFDIEQFEDAQAFALGHGETSKYAASKSLKVKTQRHFDLNGKYERPCDLAIEGLSVTSHVNFQDDKLSLHFKATEGGLDLRNIDVKQFSGEALKDITVNDSLAARDELVLISKDGNLTNHGFIYGDVTKIQAKAITNKKWAAIHGEDKLLAEATAGDIVNESGYISSSKYAQLQAEGNVVNECDSVLVNDVKRFKNRFNNRERVIDQPVNQRKKRYDAGALRGGSGTPETKGVGLRISAKGKFILNGAEVVSEGHNLITADQGLEFNAHTHTYIAKHDKTSVPLVYSSETWKTGTQVQHAHTVSKNGHTFMFSAHGGIESRGGQFASALGTQADVERDINLYSVITRDTEVNKKKIAVVFNNSEEKIIESARPTLILDHGQTSIASRKGDVNAKGAVIVGEKIYVKGVNVRLEQDVLNHQVDIQQQSLGLAVLGMNAYQTAKNGGNAWDVIASEDSTLSSVNNLMNSQGVVGNATAAANLGLNAINTAGQVAAALNQGNLAGAAMQRYGLGNADGFKPSVSVSLSVTNTQIKQQTAGHGGMYGTDIVIIADNNIDLIGYEVNSSGNVSLEAKEISMLSLELESSTESHTEKVSVGLTATGDVTNVGVGLSQSKSRTKQHVHANINASGNVDLKAEKMKMRGANIESNSITGRVDQLEMESVQDETYSEFQSVDANTSGMVSIQSQKHESKEVRRVTGIHVKSALNTPDKSFSVGQLQQKGAAITSSIAVNDFATTTTSESIHDYNKTLGIGLSANPLMLGDDTPAQQGLSSFSVDMDYGNHQSLLHASGEHEVLADTTVQFTANIPIIDIDRLENTWNEIKEAGNTLFSSQQQPTLDLNDSSFTLGSFNLTDAMAQESAVAREAAPDFSALMHLPANAQPETVSASEQADEKNISAPAAKVPAKTAGLDPATEKLIFQLANCGMVPFNFITVMEALALTSTGIGAVPGSVLATYSMDELVANMTACIDGIKHDTSLTQFLKTTMPDFEREFGHFKDFYSMTYAKNGFKELAKESLGQIAMLRSPHQAQSPATDAAPKVIIKPVIVQPLSTPKGKVIINPKVVKPLDAPKGQAHKPAPLTSATTVPHKKSFAKHANNFNYKFRKPHKHYQAAKQKEKIEPWPLMASTPKAPLTHPVNNHAHIKPENTLLLIPPPAKPASETNFFKTTSPLILREHEQQKHHEAQRYRLFNHKPKELVPSIVEPINPDYALALLPKDQVLSNAHFLQESSRPFLGSLPNHIADTFAGSRYRTYRLLEPTILPRAGKHSVPLGQYYSFEAPSSELQVRMDKGILPVWPDGSPSPIDTVHWIEFPRNTTIHVGKIAGQGNGFWGHTEQVVVERPWDFPKIKYLRSLPLKKEDSYTSFTHR